MIDKRIVADPQAHYGSGRKATRMFRWQRITGALNVLFLVFLVWLVVRLAGADRAAMLETVANPLVALPLGLLIVTVVVHMRIGMHEIIEDYLDEDRVNRLGRTANDIFALFVALVGLGSLAKIVFWG